MPTICSAPPMERGRGQPWPSRRPAQPGPLGTITAHGLAGARNRATPRGAETCAHQPHHAPWRRMHTHTPAERDVRAPLKGWRCTYPCRAETRTHPRGGGAEVDACARTPLRSGDAHAHPRKDGDTRTRTPAERRCTCTPGASCALVSKGKRAHRSWWAGEPLRSDPCSDERAESEAGPAWTLESPLWVQMTSPSPRRCLRLSQEPSPGSG